MTVLNMPPSFTTDDGAYGPVTHAVPSADLRHSSSPFRICSSDFRHLDFGKFGTWKHGPSENQPMGEGMFVVPSLGCPFQIFDTVIGLDTIDVVDIRAPSLRMAEEGHGNEPVDTVRGNAPVHAQANTRTAVCQGEGFENATGMRSCPGCNSTNSPEVADLVPSLESDNWAPLFDGRRMGTLLLHRRISPFGVAPVSVSAVPGVSVASSIPPTWSNRRHDKGWLLANVRLHAEWRGRLERE